VFSTLSKWLEEKFKLIGFLVIGSSSEVKLSVKDSKSLRDMIMHLVKL